MSKQASKTSRSTRPAPPEPVGESGRLGAEILAERKDLRPSVERILAAGLDDATAARALELFRDSLTAAGDPHRDPAAAIASASGRA